MNALTPAPAEIEASPGSDRAPLLAFVADAESGNALREGLTDALPNGFEIRRGNVRSALRALGQMLTPGALVIDVTGEDQPLALLGDLRHVVEPHVKVMVIGDRQDVTFYRQVTRALGVVEYLYKPLTADMVARHFGVQIARSTTPTLEDGGRLVCLTGVRGGVGTTTLATNLAWHIATIGRRHTILLDADLQTGTAALSLGCSPGPGLRVAVETPERVDDLFVERSATPVSERLHMLASEEALTGGAAYRPGAADKLTAVLRRRYNFVLADTPLHGGPFARDLLMLAHQRVLVLSPTLASIRDGLRMMALPAGAAQSRRPVLVLNRAGMPGGLASRVVEEALGCKIDIAVPDLGKAIGAAEGLGHPAAKANRALRSEIEALAREVAFTGASSPASRGWWSRRKRTEAISA